MSISGRLFGGARPDGIGYIVCWALQVDGYMAPTGRLAAAGAVSETAPTPRA